MTDLDEEKGELNALIREAHEALKDLTTAQRQIEQRMVMANALSEKFEAVMEDFQEKVESVMRHDISKQLDKVAMEEVAAFREVMTRAVKQAEQMVYRRFDELFDSMVPSEQTKGSEFARTIQEQLKARGYE